MTDGHSIMVGAATVFVVSDIAKSVEHYCDRLGCGHDVSAETINELVEAVPSKSLATLSGGS